MSNQAVMSELADEVDLESIGVSRPGSNPGSRTMSLKFLTAAEKRTQKSILCWNKIKYNESIAIKTQDGGMVDAGTKWFRIFWLRIVRVRIPILQLGAYSKFKMDNKIFMVKDF